MTVGLVLEVRLDQTIGQRVVRGFWTQEIGIRATWHSGGLSAAPSGDRQSPSDSHTLTDVSDTCKPLKKLRRRAGVKTDRGC